MIQAYAPEFVHRAPQEDGKSAFDSAEGGGSVWRMMMMALSAWRRQPATSPTVEERQEQQGTPDFDNHHGRARRFLIQESNILSTFRAEGRRSDVRLAVRIDLNVHSNPVRTFCFPVGLVVVTSMSPMSYSSSTADAQAGSICWSRSDLQAKTIVGSFKWETHSGSY